MLPAAPASTRPSATRVNTLKRAPSRTTNTIKPSDTAADSSPSRSVPSSTKVPMCTSRFRSIPNAAPPFRVWVMPNPRTRGISLPSMGRLRTTQALLIWSSATRTAASRSVITAQYTHASGGRPARAIGANAPPTRHGQRVSWVQDEHSGRNASRRRSPGRSDSDGRDDGTGTEANRPRRGRERFERHPATVLGHPLRQGGRRLPRVVRHGELVRDGGGRAALLERAAQRHHARPGVPPELRRRRLGIAVHGGALGAGGPTVHRRLRASRDPAPRARAGASTASDRGGTS